VLAKIDPEPHQLQILSCHNLRSRLVESDRSSHGKFLEDLFLARDIDVAVMYDLGDFTGKSIPAAWQLLTSFGAGWVIVLIGIALAAAVVIDADLNSVQSATCPLTVSSLRRGRFDVRGVWAFSSCGNQSSRSRFQ